MEEGIVLSHQLHNGQNLILQRQRIVLAQPEMRLVSLQLGSHHFGSTYFTLRLGAWVMGEIILHCDVARIVAGCLLLERK